MIPNIGALNTTLEVVEIPTNTHRIKVEDNRVDGYTDGLSAMRQAVYLILNTERYKFIIYSWNYGVELSDLIGQPTSYVIPTIKLRVEEALLQDDRITSVDNFEFDIKKNKVHVSFVVKTIFGDIETETEVNI